MIASDSEQILFVGVVSKEKGFLLQRTSEGVANKEWDVDLDLILDNLMEHLIIQVDKEGGSCTFFQHPITQHQWCVTRSNEHSLNIVVSSEKFPQLFASECVEEVEDIFKQFNDKAKDERLKMYGINDKKNTSTSYYPLQCLNMMTSIHAVQLQLYIENRGKQWSKWQIM